MAASFTDIQSIILQPTTLCNFRCRYCYLNDLDKRNYMEPRVAEAVARSLDRSAAVRRVTIVWHAGEPLTIGVERFRHLVAPFHDLVLRNKVHHTIQTNASLISERWIDLFANHQFDVGISIDGPSWSNTERRTLSGAETGSRTMAGLQMVRDSGISFSIIAVVSLHQIGTITDRIEDYVRFFAELGARTVGFNIEETEGKHVAIDATEDAVLGFWQSLFTVWPRDSPTRLREISRTQFLAKQWLTLPSDEGLGHLDPLPTVMHNGDVTVLSPELAGAISSKYDNFVVGNVLDSSLEDALAAGAEAPYVVEHSNTVSRCQAECSYFPICRGGQAANRYYEHGDLTHCETAYCVRSRQLVAQALLSQDWLLRTHSGDATI